MKEEKLKQKVIREHNRNCENSNIGGVFSIQRNISNHFK